MSHNSNSFRSPGTRMDEELIGTLTYVFITQRKHDIGWLASKLNMEYGDLHAFISGRRTMPVTLLKRITELTGDRIFFDTVFAGSDIVWNFKKQYHAHTNDASQEALEAVGAVGELCVEIKNIMHNKFLTEEERANLRLKISVAKTEIEDLFDVVNEGRKA